MAKKNRNTLKGYFETGKKPTEGQYANLIDSHLILDGENTGSLNIKGDTTLTGNITLTEITASGIISSSANVIADQFVGDGRLITGITSSLITISAQTASLNSGSLLISGTLFHSSASATILLGIETTGSIIPADSGTYDLGSPTNYFKDTFVSRSHSNTVTTTDLNADNIITGNITASQSVKISGHLSASGAIHSTRLVVLGNITASGDISASGNIYSKGLLGVDGNTTFGNSADDIHTFTGNITASGTISASGIISASHFTGIFNGAVSSSDQIATAISGAFTAPSASISTRLTTAETELSNTLVSSSNQIKTAISGAFVAPSASFSTRVTATELELGNTLISSSNQIATEISGALSTTAIASLGGNYYSSSLQSLTNITASGNIKVGGNITTQHLTASGDISASGHLNAYSASFIGNVGIGTTNPASSVPSGWGNHAKSKVLQVSTILAGGDSGLFLRNPDNNLGLDLWSDNTTGDSYIDNRYNNNDGDIRFRLKTNSTPLDAMIIKGLGKIGIGTTNPSELLTVQGNISASGFINTLSHITASGNISSSGTIIANTFLAATGSFQIIEGGAF